VATAELTISADIAGLRKQLESIKGISAEQARLMAGELNKSIKASERAAKAAAAASKKASEASAKAMTEAADAAKMANAALDGTGDAFGKAGSNSAKLAGALSMVSPAFGDAARNVADFADVGEVAAGVLGKIGPMGAALAVGLGALAVAVPLVSEALADQSVESEALVAQYASLKAATIAAAEAQATYDAALSQVRSETEVILGLKSREQVATEASIDGFRRQTQATIDANQAIIVQAALTQQRIRADIEAGATVSDRIALEQRFAGALAEAEAKSRAASESNKAARAELEIYTEVKQAELTVTDRGTKATARKTSATKADTKAMREQAEAQRKAAEEAANMAAFVERLASVEEGALTETQRLELQIKSLNQQSIDLTGSTEAASGATEILRDKIKSLNVEASASSLEQQVQAARDLQSAYDDLIPPDQLTRVQQLALLQVQVDAAFAKGTITAEAYAEMVRNIGKATDEARIKQEGWYAQTLQIADGVNGVAQIGAALFESLGTISEHAMERASTAYAEAIADRKRLGKDATDAERKAAKEEVEARRNALIKAFMVDKAVKMSQALINTALAVTSALTAGPIAGPILATAAGAAGAVQVAAIASEAPSFHRGGLIGQPDEMTATVRSGEAVLNPMGRASLGDQTIRDLNAGTSSGGGGQAIQVVYGHRAFDYFVKSHLRTRMTLPRALGKGTRTGQRGG
jgi:hypothetical protein